MPTLKKPIERLFSWLDKHLLEIGVAVLLIFIPLYPKWPLVDIRHTWVYVRFEDLLIAGLSVFWLAQVLRRKVALKIPLAIPIFIYWLVGGISLLFSLVFLRAHMANFFPNVAVLHYLRRIEYLILFFIAFASVKNPQTVKKYLIFIGLSIFGVCVYGAGQKFLGWPAFITMNEEFAKGLPLYLGPNNRIPSTFAGHYDLAAWLVLMIALWGSLIFGLKKIIWRLAAFILCFLSFVLLLLTASRISFVAYLLSTSLVLFFQKKKWLIIPVVGASLFLMNYVSGSSSRFGKTFRVERVVYDVKTGKPIAKFEEEEVGTIITEEEEVAEEDLPLGSGFINLPGVIEEEEPVATEVAVIKRPIVTTSLKTATKASEIATISGEFLIRRAIVYDISFTTRFQGTWPRAIKAFSRNPLLGSGYSSIDVGTDNSFLRSLGETGLLGFLAFMGIFATFLLLFKQSLARIKDQFGLSFVIGVGAGLLGLMFNAVLIDVFEASKVAYSLWLILGIAVGLVHLLLPKRESLSKDFLEVLRHPFTTLATLVLLISLIFGPSIKNYFTGDDFTWLRWAASTRPSDLPAYFFSSGGFFYRPLAKLYFYFANPIFGLRPQGYHLFSLLLHLGSSFAAYLILFRMTRKRFASSLGAVLFALHPVISESLLWVSTTSHMMASCFYLWSFWAYISWRQNERKRGWLFYLLSLVTFGLSLFSHERAVVFPVLIIFFDWLFGYLKKKRWDEIVFEYFSFWWLLALYSYLRNIIAKAHGLSGDYSYSLKNLPFNLIGNSFGYLGEMVAGLRFIPLYDSARFYLRSHKLVALGLLVVVFFILRKAWRKIGFREKVSPVVFKWLVFALGWFLILLLPFLGLGNLSERYAYPSHLGFTLVLALLIDGLFYLPKNLKFTGLKVKKQVLGLGLVALAVVFLLGFYFKELEHSKDEWYQAGETANKILLTVGTNHTQFTENTHLFFVDVPLRLGRAWIFPVGLEDGLWFIYRDETLKVTQGGSLEEAFGLAEALPASHVFVFEDGILKRAERKPELPVP